MCFLIATRIGSIFSFSPDLLGIMNLLCRDLEFIMNRRKGKGKSNKLQGLGFPKLEPSSGGHKAPTESKIHKD